MRKIQEFFRRILLRNTSYNNEQAYLHLILMVATLYAVVVHVGMVIIYTAIKQNGLAIMDACFVLVHCAGFYMVSMRKHTLAGLSLSLEVCLFVLITTFFAGTSINNVYYLFVVLLMQLSIPYGTRIMRVCVVIFIWLCVLGVSLFDLYGTPQIVFLQGSFVLKMYNTQVLFVGTIAQLTIGNLIQSQVERYRSDRLAKYEQEANTDSLTGLANRRSASRLFLRIRENGDGKKWCAAMLDIDDFKKINDTCGHLVGDKVLVALAACIRGTLRSSDRIFRWGGEEFLILLSGVGIDNGARIMEKLRNSVESMRIPIVLANGDEKMLTITVTIGLSDMNPEDTEGSIVHSDGKLYAGKTSGKNKVVF